MYKDLTNLNNSDFKLRYGLMAIDRRQFESDDEFLNILHFCGYQVEPDEEDIEILLKELQTDEEHELTEIADYIMVIPAPEDIVEKYQKIIDEGRQSLLN